MRSFIKILSILCFSTGATLFGLGSSFSDVPFVHVALASIVFLKMADVLGSYAFDYEESEGEA